MTARAAAEVGRIRKLMDSTRLLLRAGDPDSAANRAYYAVFHLFALFFELRKQAFKTHSSLQNAVHRELIRTGTVPMGIGEDLSFLSSTREAGDYSQAGTVTEENAELAIAAAERILNAVLPLIENGGRT